jgi:hypothetical protein
MSVSMNAVPVRTSTGARSALSGMSYPQLVSLSEQMKEQDSRVIFDSLRPIGDELWNFVNDQRTVGEICESVCMEFDFRFDPALLVPLLEGMAGAGLIEIKE